MLIWPALIGALVLVIGSIRRFREYRSTVDVVTLVAGAAVAAPCSLSVARHRLSQRYDEISLIEFEILLWLLAGAASLGAFIYIAGVGNHELRRRLEGKSWPQCLLYWLGFVEYANPRWTPAESRVSVDAARRGRSGGSLLGLGVAVIAFGVLWALLGAGVRAVGVITVGVIALIGGSVDILAEVGSKRKAIRSRRTRCAQCGYDLRGLAEARCPECGLPFPEAWLEPGEPRRTPGELEREGGKYGRKDSASTDE